MSRDPTTTGTATRDAAGRLGLLAWGLAILTITTNIVWVLTSAGTRDALTIGTVLLFFLASLSHAIAHRGIRWSVGFFAPALGYAWLIEAIGTGTGWPFGAYEYGSRLGPTVASVPLLVPLAWAMMAYPCSVVSCRVVAPAGARIALAASLLAGWDLFLDPQMVAEGHWLWLDAEAAVPGVPGIPVTNYAGWLLAAAILMTVLHLLTAPAGEESPEGLLQPLTLLTWTYCSSVLANAVFLQRPGVALVGGVGMGVPMAIVWARLRSAGWIDDRARTSHA